MDTVTIKLKKSEYNHMMEVMNSVEDLLKGIKIDDTKDEQSRYDTKVRLDELAWLSSLPAEMQTSVKQKTGDKIVELTEHGLKLIEETRDEFDEDDEDIIDDVLTTHSTTMDILKQAVKLYVTKNKLLDETGKLIQYDDFLKAIARGSTSKIGTENLDELRPKRDMSTLASCLVKKAKKVPKAKATA